MPRFDRDVADSEERTDSGMKVKFCICPTFDLSGWAKASPLEGRVSRLVASAHSLGLRKLWYAKRQAFRVRHDDRRSLALHDCDHTGAMRFIRSAAIELLAQEL